ncbi:hypothetical protein CR513_52762, partial [Mucuna pruriens]
MKSKLGGGQPNKSKSQSEGLKTTQSCCQNWVRTCYYCTCTTTTITTTTINIFNGMTPIDGSSTLNDSSNIVLSNVSMMDGWIINFGATNYMMYDSNDFINFTQPRRTNIANAKGVTYPIIGAGIVALSPTLSLSHTSLVPSLSNKFMLVGQATEELDCCTLIILNFVFFRIFLPRRY